MRSNDSEFPTRTIEVTLPDGTVSPVKIYPSETTDKPVIALWPGFGMGARYYRPIATYLAKAGYSTFVGELRGQGESTAVATRKHSWGYHHLASQDYPMAIRAAKKELGLADDHPVVLLTHSLGGQIAGPFLARPEARELNVKGLMGVGSGSPYADYFTGRTQLRLKLGSRAMALTTRIVGYWPGGRFDIINYGRQAAYQIQEWAKLGAKNSFADLHGQDMDYVQEMTKINLPVLFTRFDGDEDCPEASAKGYLTLMPNADSAFEKLPGELGHNRWAREPEVAANRLMQFIDEKIA